MDRDEAMRLMGDYLEGELSEDVRIAFEAHILSDPVCQEELERLRAVIEEAKGLPEGIAPDRNLWPDIQVRLGVQSAPGIRHQFERMRRPLLAAAAVVVLATASILSARLLGNYGSDTTPFARLIERGVEELTGMARAEEEYMRIVDDLNRSMARGREVLPEATRQLLDDHLRLIDDAITSSRSAVAQNPSDLRLQGMLAEAWRHKVELLQMTAHVIALNS